VIQKVGQWRISASGTAAAICCMAPLLVVVFGAVGLTAWLAKADYVLIPALILCLALVAFGLYRRRLHDG
jgi:mercuric ion transport protein